MPQVSKPSLCDTWTQENQEEALKQGWGIFDNGCYVEIQRHDEHDRGDGEPAFDGDLAAYDFVFSKAGTDPIYTLALLNVDRMNGEKLKIKAPDQVLLTLIDGEALNIPWKVVKKPVAGIPSRDPEGIFVILDTKNQEVAFIKNGDIAETIKEVVNAARDPDNITMSRKTYDQGLLELQGLYERVRRAESKFYPVEAAPS